MWKCPLHLPSACRRLERLLEPVELELFTVVRLSSLLSHPSGLQLSVETRAVPVQKNVQATVCRGSQA